MSQCVVLINSPCSQLIPVNTTPLQCCGAVPTVSGREGGKFRIECIEDIPTASYPEARSFYAQFATTTSCDAENYGQCGYILFLTHFIHFYLQVSTMILFYSIILFFTSEIPLIK